MDRKKTSEETKRTMDQETKLPFKKKGPTKE